MDPLDRFETWPLRPELLAGLAAQKFEVPTPVQREALAPALEGRDLRVQSRTGSGKTLAFGLPLLQRLEPGPGKVEAVIVLPTRELATQVATVLARLAQPLRIGVAVLTGGGSYREQFAALHNGARIVVGTPGRLADHMARGTISLSQCRMLVLDEGDEMLDMGFAEELDRLLEALPKERQTWLFSATMTAEARGLAERFQKDAVEIRAGGANDSSPEITHVIYEVFREHREEALVNVLHVEQPTLAIIFCHTKAESETLAHRLQREGFDAAFLNGDLPQTARTRTLNAFRRRELRMLVATDVAARGIDVRGISHVFNLGVPQSSETYIHRVGRTGRAGATGTAVTFVPPADGSRWRRLMSMARLRYEQRPVPQGEEVRTVLRKAWREALSGPTVGDVDTRLRTFAELLLAEVPPLDLVTALLHRDPGAAAALDAGADVPVPRPRAERPERAERFDRNDRNDRNDRPVRPERERTERRGPPDRDDRADQPDRTGRKLSEWREPGMQRVHLNMGRTQGLVPARLVQLVCNGAGVQSSVLGAFAIHAHFTFFDVKVREADRVIEALNTLSFDGRRMRATPVPEGPPGEGGRGAPPPPEARVEGRGPPAPRGAPAGDRPIRKPRRTP